MQTAGAHASRFFYRRRLDSYPRASNSGALPYGKLRIKLEAEDLMLGAADFDAAREFIEKLSALRG